MKRPTLDDRFAGWVAEIGVEPFEAVGPSRLDRLRWLVAFIQRPQMPSFEHPRVRLSKKDLEHAYREIAAFVIAEGAEPRLELEIDADELESVIGEVNDGIHSLAAGDAWSLSLNQTWGPGTHSAYEQIRYGPRGELERLRLSRGSVADDFVWHAREIVAVRPIRQCSAEGCGRLFVPTKRQQYCSSLCSQKMRNQRFREGHTAEERQQRRRQSFLKQIARDNPALAKHLAKRAKRKP